MYTFKDAGMDGKDDAWWTMYRYQLEAFVDQMRGRIPQVWLDGKESLANMEWIENIYAKACPPPCSSVPETNCFATFRPVLEAALSHLTHSPQGLKTFTT
jgi:hypothetical protein